MTIDSFEPEYDDTDDSGGVYSIGLCGPTWRVFEHCDHEDFDTRSMVAHLVIQALSMSKGQIGGYWDELVAELCVRLTNYENDSSGLAPEIAEARAALGKAAWNFRDVFRAYREKINALLAAEVEGTKRGDG